MTAVTAVESDIGVTVMESDTSTTIWKVTLV